MLLNWLPVLIDAKCRFRTIAVNVVGKAIPYNYTLGFYSRDKLNKLSFSVKLYAPLPRRFGLNPVWVVCWTHHNAGRMHILRLVGFPGYNSPPLFLRRAY